MTIFYKDISTYFGVLEDMDLLCLDDDSILNGFINLLNTTKDQDGLGERPFRPNIGNTLMQLLEEPVDDMTAYKINMCLQDTAKQCARATLSPKTTVTPNRESGSFDLRIVLISGITGKEITGFFNLKRPLN
jgi:phage baseplate assembly protein W